MMIVKRSRNFANQPLNDAIHEELTNTWSQAFFGRIPEERLEEAFEKAAYSNTSSFAINFHDINNAWNGIAADLKNKKSVKSCPQYGTIYGHLNGRPETKIVHPDGMRDLIVPCPTCRREEFQAVYANAKATVENPNAEGVFAILAEMKTQPIPETDRLLKAVESNLTGQQVRDLYVKAFGSSAWDSLPERLRK